MKDRTYEKDKYFIYNEDYKILTFCYISESGFVHMSIPGITYGVGEDSIGIFYDSIIEKMVEKENLCFLESTIQEDKIYKEVNRKLIKQNLKVIRNYYSCYKEFSKEDYEEINKLVCDLDVIPLFFTIEEILDLIKKNKKRSYDVSPSMKLPLEELDKKLKFIKY